MFKFRKFRGLEPKPPIVMVGQKPLPADSVADLIRRYGPPDEPPAPAVVELPDPTVPVRRRFNHE